jgi:hypothetical protein
MNGREDYEDDFTTEYARFAKNSRGIPDDFDTWINDLGGRAKRQVDKHKKKYKSQRKRPSDYGDD